MVGQLPDLSVTIPISTTWKRALKRIEEALGDIGEPVLMIPKQLRNPNPKRRGMAARLAEASFLSDTSNQLRIRTQVDVSTLPMPPRAIQTSSRKMERKCQAAGVPGTLSVHHSSCQD